MAGYNITITSGAQGVPGQGVPTGGTTGQFLKKNTDGDYDTVWSSSTAVVNSLNDINDVDVTGVTNAQVLQFNTTSGNWEATTLATGGGTWGSITGTLSNQTDLQSALDAKAATVHTHVKANITDFSDGDYATAAQGTTADSALQDLTGSSIKTLSDVFTTMTPTDGQHLVFDTTNGWQAETVTDNDTTDHTALSNIGTNTHAQIDTHIADSTIHFTQASISVTESQISDLQAYLLNINNELLADLSDVPALVANKLLKVNATADGLIWGDPSGSSVAWGDITGTLANQTDLQSALDGKAASSHTHVEADITDLQAYLLNLTGESIKDLSDVFTTMTPTDGQVLTFDTTNGWQAETLPTDNDTIDHTLFSNIGTNTHAQIDTHIADATVHFTQAAISITESQVSDLGTYETAFTKNTAFNKNFGAIIGTVTEGNDARLSDARTPTAHTHTEADITDLGTYIPASEKAAINGVATLDGSGLIPTNQLPGLAITSTFVVASEIAQLALTVEEGDLAVRTDENKTYASLNATNATMADWQELLTPTDAVQSVDGRTGTVTLSDLYATVAQGALADSALQNVVEDTTPTLGGSLDVAGNSITDVGATDLTLAKSGTGDLILSNSGTGVISIGDNVYPEVTGTNGQVLTTNGVGVLTWATPTDNDTTDHTALSNIGTNTHAQIDTHIADATVHFTQATISITESQISDLGTYSAVGHTHVKANITDFSDGDYATAGQGTLADSSTQPGDNVSTLTNDAGYVSETSDTIQTTDATGTVLVTFAIASGEEKILDIKVHGHEDATNDHIWKRMTVGVKNVGGVASIVGGVDSAVGFDAGASAWSIVTSVSSGNVLVTVTGEAAKTIDWRSTLRSD